MKDKILQILSEVLKVEENELMQFDENVELMYWGLDSLNAIEVIVMLEDSFNISIDDEDLLIDNINTVNKLIALVEKYTK